MAAASSPPQHTFSADEVAAFYGYDDTEPLNVVSTRLDSTAWYDQYELEYQSLGETVYARLMLPKAGAPGGAAGAAGAAAVPCMVGVHGMFSTSVNQFWSAADFCARRGIAVIYPSLPYHHERTKGYPIVAGQQLVVGSPEEVAQNLRRAVVDVRRAVDVVSAIPEIDASRISVGGVSLGGTIAALALKVDPRFSRAVSVVGASGIGDLIREGGTDLGDIFRFAARLGLVDLERYIDELRITDSALLPDTLPRPALLFSGKADDIAPPFSAVKLRESLTLAEQVWTTGGHYLPMHAARYLLVDYLLDHAPARIEIGGGLSFAFTETVGKPVIGADNLWVSVDVETGAAGWTHRVSVPMVNRDVPMVVLSEASYAQLESAFADRHFPAFVYITRRDSAMELDAALAYAQILGIGANPSVYYIEPEGPTQYRVGTLSPMAVSRARNTIESVLKFPGGSAAAMARTPVPLSVFDRLSLVDGAVGLRSWFDERLSVDRLAPIQWFPNYPVDNPRWAEAP
jgi:cephalosporin-C deacetylase-like acetyl esterase